MKIAYLDCFSGISGDMFLAALLDAGLDLGVLQDVAGRLGLSGVQLEARKEMRGTLQATRLSILDATTPAQRNLEDILSLIKRSQLAPAVVENASAIFRMLAGVESKIHQIAAGEIHFHEIGAVDSLVDIVGSCAAIHQLGLKGVYASVIPVTSGFVQTAHGTLPLPSPAAAELLKGVPVTLDPRREELVTPTGAALLSQFCKGYGRLPEMTIEAVGYGAGGRPGGEIPNVLRILIGETAASVEDQEADTVCVLETNIDDMNPQLISHVFDVLLEKGALDVYVTPIQMKDSRTGMKLSVVGAFEDQAKLAEIIFRETPSLGIRVQKTERIKLKREIVDLDTEYGPVPIKVAFQNGKPVKVAPEYKVLKAIADKTDLPLRDLYDKILLHARKKFLH